MGNYGKAGKSYTVIGVAEVLKLTFERPTLIELSVSSCQRLDPPTSERITTCTSIHF